MDDEGSEEEEDEMNNEDSEESEENKDEEDTEDENFCKDEESDAKEENEDENSRINYSNESTKLLKLSQENEYLNKYVGLKSKIESKGKRQVVKRLGRNPENKMFPIKNLS